MKPMVSHSKRKQFLSIPLHPLCFLRYQQGRLHLVSLFILSHTKDPQNVSMPANSSSKQKAGGRWSMQTNKKLEPLHAIVEWNGPRLELSHRFVNEHPQPPTLYEALKCVLFRCASSLQRQRGWALSLLLLNTSYFLLISVSQMTHLPSLLLSTDCEIVIAGQWSCLQTVVNICLKIISRVNECINRQWGPVLQGGRLPSSSSGRSYYTLYWICLRSES